jgi:hypothetical protein
MDVGTMTLRVTLEIVRFGNEDDKHIIGVANISNQSLSSYGDICDYIVKIDDGGGLPEQEFIIKDHERRLGAWHLVHRVLDHAFRREES